jgi:hypothetical protein
MLHKTLGLCEIAGIVRSSYKQQQQQQQTTATIFVDASWHVRVLVYRKQPSNNNNNSNKNNNNNRQKVVLQRNSQIFGGREIEDVGTRGQCGAS